MATKKQTPEPKRVTVKKVTKRNYKQYFSPLINVTDNIKETYQSRPRLFMTWVLALLLLIGLGSFLWFNKGIYLAGTINGKIIPSYEFYNRLTKANGTETFDAIVRETLIMQEAAKKGISATDQDVDQKLSEIEKRLGGKEQLNTAISQNNTTMEEVRKQLSLQVLIEKILADKLNVSDKEVTDYMAKNKDAVKGMSKNDVKDQLKSEKLGQALQPWLEEVKKNSTINTYF